VHFGQLLSNGEPNAEAAFRPVQRSVCLREQIKNAVQQFRRQSNTSVDDLDHA